AVDVDDLPVEHLARQADLAPLLLVQHQVAQAAAEHYALLVHAHQVERRHEVLLPAALQADGSERGEALAGVDVDVAALAQRLAPAVPNCVVQKLTQERHRLYPKGKNPTPPSPLSHKGRGGARKEGIEWGGQTPNTPEQGRQAPQPYFRAPPGLSRPGREPMTAEMNSSTVIWPLCMSCASRRGTSSRTVAARSSLGRVSRKWSTTCSIINRRSSALISDSMRSTTAMTNSRRS